MVFRSPLRTRALLSAQVRPLWHQPALRQREFGLESTRSHVNVMLEKIQRKSRVREWTPKNAPRIRAGVTKKVQKAELKKN